MKVAIKEETHACVPLHSLKPGQVFITALYKTPFMVIDAKGFTKDNWFSPLSFADVPVVRIEDGFCDGFTASVMVYPLAQKAAVEFVVVKND